MGSSESQTFNYYMPSPFPLILSVYSAQVNILWRNVDLGKKTSHLKKGNNPFKHKMSLFFSPSNVSITVKMPVNYCYTRCVLALPVIALDD